MDESFCSMCKRPLGADPRAKYCCERHRWRGWWQRAADLAVEAKRLPLGALPEEAEQVLPIGPERLQIANQLLLIGRAPAGAYGYRVGTAQGRSQILRWFPAARLRDVPMFRLEPFEWPMVPVRGIYAVVYMDRRCLPIGGLRFSIAIDQVDSRLHCSDGDRTYKPRPRE